MEKKQKKTWLLFFGRLEKEKGFMLILDFLKQAKNRKLPIDVYIFGAGSWEEELMELAQKSPNIHFFWRKPLEEIKRYLPNIHYCLMPSLCIETFGLSALNVLSRGIPVVGFRKGGLIPFISDSYAIEKKSWSTKQKKFSTMIHDLIEEREQNDDEFYQELSKKSRQIAKNYSPKKWIKNFQKCIERTPTKKILIINDFSNTIGGIETYLNDAKTLLEQEGYQVIFFGKNCPPWKQGKIKKYLGIWIALINFWDAIRLYFLIKKEKPDLLWYNNLFRRLGWLSLWVARNHKAKKILMYHDLGYFYPFPHLLEDTKKILPLTVKNYLRMGNIPNTVGSIFLLGKIFLLEKLSNILLIKKQVNNIIDLHLVPSDFMEPLLQQQFEIKKEQITTLPHFIQK